MDQPKLLAPMSRVRYLRRVATGRGITGGACCANFIGIIREGGMGGPVGVTGAVPATSGTSTENWIVVLPPKSVVVQLAL